MSETIYEFEDGPYDVMEFKVEEKDGKAIIEVNDGSLGRLTIESLDAVNELRNALDIVEKVIEERNRRQEEF